ncbi:MAG: thiolase domain-containing protein [Dehalococcoidia bacterium]
MVDLRKAAAIVGVYEHPVRYAPDKSEGLIMAESIINALDDAGLGKNDVDALFSTGGLTGMNLVDYLNLEPKWVDFTQVGGGSFEVHLSHAATAIAAGRINCAVITYAATPRVTSTAIGTGGFGRQGRIVPDPVPSSFEEIYGFTTVGLYAMIARRHMHQFGTTSAQLAEISVAMRKHAGLNPYAFYRDPITVENVLGSRMISDPLHLLDCCVISDGGGAVVVASPQVARQCKSSPVWVLGVAEGIAHQGAGHRDLVYMAASQTGKPAMEMAGVTPGEIAMCMIYDSFTITVLETLEDLGFCKKGEGGSFVGNGRIQLGGELPINTDGGGLSSNHPGMRGIFLLIEATRQLRGDFAGTARQVPNCNIALAHGTGGALGSRHSGCTVILGRD